MEFHEKLQELRRQKGLTQEELAQALYVSRTAISKWESGRGYPNIDSLKAIAAFYAVTVDELLSGEELLTIAAEDTKQKETQFRDIVFGLLDLSAAVFFFLPFFGQETDGVVASVSLLSLTAPSLWLKIVYGVVIVGMMLFGVMTLALQNCQQSFWVRHKSKLSLVFSAAGALLFIVSLQPYAAVMLFVFLIIKTVMLLKPS